MTTPIREPMVSTRTKAKPSAKPKLFPPYHVILCNDDFHTMEFVIETLCKAMMCDVDQAIQWATEAHTRERAIVWTGPKEVAELKAEQIQTFHETLSNGKKLGPLTVLLEPAV